MSEATLQLMKQNDEYVANMLKMLDDMVDMIGNINNSLRGE